MAIVQTYTTSTPGLPCNWTVDIGCCPDWDEYDPEVQTAAAEYAALSLWAATGRRFGACTRTVRPCGRDCEDNLGWGGGYYYSEGSWFPYILNGVWRNCCASGCNRCRPGNQVWLTPPVSGIVEVRFADGTVLDPSTYRVDDWQWLVRQGPNLDSEPITATDGGLPRSNDYNYPVTGPLVPTGDQVVWEVTYLWGRGVPAVLQRAAGQLACEWAKSCIGAACMLPQRVTSIARQGVTVSLADIDQLLQNGLTGLGNVDSIIQRFNPGRLPSKMGIASPDLPVIRETTFQGF